MWTSSRRIKHHVQTQINPEHFLLQKETFNTKWRKKLSDSAKKLFRDKPDLFEAATWGYNANYSILNQVKGDTSALFL